MPIKLCASVAVSNPQALDRLPGAIHASFSMIKWARAAGFATCSLTDAEGVLVTVADIRAMLTPILSKADDVIDHFIFHFAGHGLKSGAEDQFLLLSKWRSQPDEAIRLSRFVRLLQFYQPRQVSLFIDACRSARRSDTEDTLNGSGVLDIPDDEPVEFLEDRFRAAGAGKAAYMIHDMSGGAARCLFSSILLRALCGKYPEAIDTRGTEKVVTTANIYGAVKHHLPLEAARYRVTFEPSLKPSFVAPHDVYTRLPIDFDPPDLPEPSFPPPTSPPAGHDQFESPDFEKTFNRIKELYASEERPTHFETGAGLVVTGGEVRGEPLVTYPGEIALDNKAKNATWWRFMNLQPASLLVEITNGVAIGAAAIPGTIVTISIGAGHTMTSVVGAESVIYRPNKGWGSEQDLKSVSADSENVIAKMRAGNLRADEAMSVAVRIRALKHVNPMLGVIAAYLYDAIGDRDSIRRIAWFYAHVNQPIPFDVALLADLKGNGRAATPLMVRVPAVHKRAPRTVEEEQHSDYFRETYEVDNVVVAGGFPWLRQGWFLLDVVRLPVHPAILDFATSVLPFTFTTLSADAGREIAALIKKGEL